MEETAATGGRAQHAPMEVEADHVRQAVASAAVACRKEGWPPKRRRRATGLCPDVSTVSAEPPGGAGGAAVRVPEVFFIGDAGDDADDAGERSGSQCARWADQDDGDEDAWLRW